jgi:hypothetical protein
MSQSENTLNPPAAPAGPTLTLVPAQPRYPDTPTPRYSPTSRLAVRLWSAFAFALCTAMLALGLYLHPDPSGTGTHQQLHLPPCGMLALTGYPCPTCGCTTAVSYIAHGHWVMAFYTQPFGAAVGLLALAIALLSLIGLLTGRWIGPSMFLLNWYWRTIVAASLTLLAAAWIFKILLVKLGHSG